MSGSIVGEVGGAGPVRPAGLRRGRARGVALPLALVAILLVTAACDEDLTGPVDPGAPSATPDTRTVAPAPVDPGAPVAIGACAEGGAGSVVDGWARTVTPGWVQLDAGDLRVEIHYSFPMDDQLRDGIVTDRIWDRLLSSRVQPGQTVWGGEAFGLPYYTAGTATDLATGRPLYIQVAVELDNGIAFPVVVVAPDEATLSAAFASSADVVAMRRYNYLPLSCGSLAGLWTTSSSSAMYTYSVTGMFTGITVAAGSIDLAFDGGGGYAMRKTAYLNGVWSDEQEAGTVAIEEHGITLSGDAGTTPYESGFVAIEGGLALFIRNRQFSGLQYLLYRAE